VQAVGEAVPPYQNIEIDSGGVPVPLTYAVGAPWLNLINRFTTTPAPLPAGISRLPTTAGEYDGSFTVTSPGSSLYVPVTLLVTPGPAAQPVVSQVVNAASGIAGGLSPGEILSIRGYGVGSSAIGGLRLDNNGNVVSQVNGLQVTFDGKPAPLIYTSANQTNLIVPYEIAGKTSTVMQVTYLPPSGTTLQTGAWTLPVVSTAPGIFTVDATGTGQGSIVNQDGTVNSVSNPAVRGSIVSIYATGEGQTSPAGVTGGVAKSTNLPIAQVTATIGGQPASVQYAGSAPGEVEGLLQANVLVPATVPTGALPVALTVGGILSQSGVTISVK
jgi:trimeric autotransporter adhesin